MPETVFLDFSPIALATPPQKETQVWVLDLSRITDIDSHPSFSVLAPSERERAQRFKFPYLQDQHIITRLFLRLCLARYADEEPQNLEFAAQPQGKPYITNSKLPLFFNLSHSGSFAVLAVSRTSEIGVDIETIRKHDFWGIAERFFHPDEFAFLKTKNHVDSEKFFYQLWTLKEAFLKALGLGIGAGLESINIDLSSNPLQFTLSDKLKTAINNWSLFHTQLSPDTFLAIAHQAPAATPLWLDAYALFSPEG